MLKHSFPIALLDMGLIAQKTAVKADDWNRAAGYFAQFVAIDPSDVGYLLLANALRHAGHPDEADQAFQQALRLSSDINQAQQKLPSWLLSSTSLAALAPSRAEFRLCGP